MVCRKSAAAVAIGARYVSGVDVPGFTLKGCSPGGYEVFNTSSIVYLSD